MIERLMKFIHSRKLTNVEFSLLSILMFMIFLGFGQH